METVSVNPQERAYFNQIADEPAPYDETRYVVFEWYRKFVAFETTNYADALQVAEWIADGREPAADFVHSYTYTVNAPYQNGGYGPYLLHTQAEYQRRLDERADK